MTRDPSSRAAGVTNASLELPVERPETGTCVAAEPFALQVLDEAMAPEFPCGCIILVDPTGHARDGAYVVAEVQGDWCLRQLRDDGAGGFALHALHGDHPPLVLGDGLGALRGVVTQRAGRRRREHKRYE